MSRGTPIAPSPGNSTKRREVAVLLSRCAWHLRYRGYPLIGGVASWSGWGVKFTDGICAACAVRFRDEHRAFLQRRRTDAPGEREPQRQVA
jgi:hypothetical protein